MILANHGIISSSGASFDVDALAFITSASITDNTQKTAVNKLVTDLKSANIWTKMKALYPFVGGTATQHRFNLKDPRTVNAAFYLDFMGGGTHSATGYQPNGTTAYADTKLIPSANLLSDSHISIYLNTLSSNTSSPYVMGAYNQENQALAVRTYGNSDGNSRTYNNSQLNASSSIATSNGYWLSNIIASSHRQLRNNIVKTFQVRSGTNPTISIYIGTLNTGGVFGNVASSQTTGLVSIGDALSLSEETALHTAVQAYQTTLGRAV